MRRALAILIGAATLSTLCGVASAQTTPANFSSESNKGYAEFVAQSAFGNVTSQSFGGEAGVTIMPGLQVFLEGGRARDTSPASLGAGAQAIAGFLSRSQTGVNFQAKQPVNFGVVGVRYLIPTTLQFEPYVMGGAGVARVIKEVTFTVGNTDVTNNLSQYGVALGTDLAGAENKAMIVAGVGIAWPVLTHIVVDLHYRYGRILLSGGGMNLSRAGIGIGVRF